MATLDDSLACMTRREIPSSCGNLHNPAFYIRCFPRHESWRIIGSREITCCPGAVLKGLFQARKAKKSRLRLHKRCSCEVRLWRRTYRFKPAANVDLGMGFSAEMAGTGCIRCFRIPLQNTQVGIIALNNEPMNRGICDPAADFASELLKSCHALHLAS